MRLIRLSLSELLEEEAKALCNADDEDVLLTYLALLEQGVVT